MDYEQISKEFLCLLRGSRSQVAWSRRLGYRSNVAYSWESGRRWPTAAETFRAIRRSGIDLDAGVIRFYGDPPPWLTEIDVASPNAVAQLMNDLRGQTSITDLAQTANLSRYSVSRWLSASTQPRLPDFLRLVQAASLRMVDLLAAFADPMDMPTVAPIWARLEGRRRGASLYPWTQAILRALELEAYADLDTHSTTWIAENLSIPLDNAETCISFLSDTGQIVWTGSHWQQEELAVDTRRHPEVNRQLKEHWTQVAADRIESGAPGQFSYNVFSVSRADFGRIRDLHLAYFHALRAIVAESEGSELVAVANVQLFELD